LPAPDDRALCDPSHRGALLHADPHAVPGQAEPAGWPSPRRAATLNADRLPAFSMVVPDVQDDQHDGCVSCGDRFAQTWIGRIVRSAPYPRGDVAVLVTWDEDDYSSGNHVPLVVVSPYTTPGS